MNLLIPPDWGQILPPLFFWKEGFGIELPVKVDMPLKKELNQTSNEFELL